MMNPSVLRCPRCGSNEVSRHMTPLPPGESNPWSPVREEGYMCGACRLIEACFTDAVLKDYEAFRVRWNDPIEVVSPEQRRAWSDANQRYYEEQDRAWTWPEERHVTTREQRAQKLEEERTWSAYDVRVSQRRGEQLPEYKYGFPVGETYTAAVLANPDDDAPRWAYARWLRTFDTDAARNSAEFVEWQLRMAESLRADPRADIKAQFPEQVFSRREKGPDHIPDQLWWRYPGSACEQRQVGDYRGLGEATVVFLEEEIISRGFWVRGFKEHVAIKAARFLEIADELYSLAPIRHLNLTYCKGLDHKDSGLWKALLDSPHLDRIRALKFPVRIFGQDNEYTELNRLTDADLQLLAASSHLRGLRYLNLEDERRLSIHAFDALAKSPHLPELSFVGHDILSYGSAVAGTAWGNLGRPTREVIDRPLERFAAELEAHNRRRIVWLHPVENYGTETPDLEAVVEHPVATQTR